MIFFRFYIVTVVTERIAVVIGLFPCASMLLTTPTLPSRQERLILEETVTPLTPPSSAPAPLASKGQDTIVRSLADWERKQERLERHLVNNSFVNHY